ncbi:putative DEAD box ATP-dependent RNA helicase [Emericellopsis atlantica]|uniref:ATP-dependent RNA helicase n=1 Tax=Emericellopsis atlantica TaxID=2614577 RepID=A0A9P7ZSN6_9HYPO|nr:putative DEAD box ATP-dependent RNA helicase [Emericellopsis atlantica]KAG9257515.1 putative DEAD box ATP-dependent RNA helicase [Emericellopsis atlantica]
MYARYIPPAKPAGAPKATTSSQPPAPSPTPAATPQAVGAPGFSYARYVPGANASPKPPVTPAVHYFDDEEPTPSSVKRKRIVNEEGETDSSAKKPKKTQKGEKSPGRETNGVSSSKNDDAEGTESREVAKSGKERKGKKEKKQKKQKEPDNDMEVEDQQSTLNGDTMDAERITESKAERKAKKGKKSDDSKSDKQPDRDEVVEDPSEPKEKRKKEKKKAELENGYTTEETDKRHKTVLERKTKSLKLADKAAAEAVSESEEEPEEVHDLEPLPQPKLVSAETPNPTYETLPGWLADPIRVAQDTRTPFSELGLLPKAARVLEEKGFPDAFAVQTKAIPLLLPTSKQRPGDLLISAATGSGKTLAYALPIVRDISQGLVTRLRALVVLPTRELVKQAQDVFELCAKAYEGGDRKRVRIGVAIGSQTLKSEQAHLMEQQSRYDPEAYKRIQQERQGDLSDVTHLSNLDPDETDPRLGPWEGEVVDFFSKVDVLICTPGRLVEHLEQTPGFDLDYVRWLVVDEADKLLAQSFQGWLDVVLEKFKTSKFTAREFPDMDLEGVRKVILSATLTRDLSLLNQLALRRPQLIVLESESDAPIAEHALPALLEEFAIRVHNTNLKPLYLLELLKAGHMKSAGAAPSNNDATADEGSDTSSDESDDSSSEDDTSSDDDSDSDSDAEPKPSKYQLKKSTLPVSLIFTKSNEAALRLSRLLTLLDPSLSSHISTLTSTTPTNVRRKTLRAFTTPSSPIRIVIASDLVARGIDLPKLEHVINYDLPPSAAGYVHRVGRTARAGRTGRAWTLVGDDESGWFWGKIAKGAGIRRTQKVGRVRIEEMGEERVANYEAALEKLGQEAMDARKR